MQIEKGGAIMYAGEPRQVLNVVSDSVVLAGGVTMSIKQAAKFRYSPPANAEKKHRQAPEPVQGRLF